eukprot:Tbor_TRINITY_DN2705_c0_g1::TRINITY_DN2705_c0_g1_i1::g.15219::m.15219
MDEFMDDDYYPQVDDYLDELEDEENVNEEKNNKINAEVVEIEYELPTMPPIQMPEEIRGEKRQVLYTLLSHLTTQLADESRIERVREELRENRNTSLALLQVLHESGLAKKLPKPPQLDQDGDGILLEEDDVEGHEEGSSPTANDVGEQYHPLPEFPSSSLPTEITSWIGAPKVPHRAVSGGAAYHNLRAPISNISAAYQHTSPQAYNNALHQQPQMGATNTHFMGGGNNGRIGWA